MKIQCNNLVNKFNIKFKIFCKRAEKTLHIFGLITGVLGISFFSGIAQPLYNNLPWVYRSNFAEKIESIKPTQSYAYIKSIMDESKVSEEFLFMLENGEIEKGTRKIWSNDLFVLIGYFKSDESLYGYILINQHEKFTPKIGTDYYETKGFGELLKTTFIDAHEHSLCYIDTVRGNQVNDVLGSSYYMELYDFNRSDFSYGLAVTDLGINSEMQLGSDFYKVNYLPCFKMGETLEIENPAKYELYQPYRKMYPNAMMLFDNRCDIDSTEFFNTILDGQFAISNSDLRRLY